MSDDISDDIFSGKGCLFVVALGLAVLIGYAVLDRSNSWGRALLYGVGAGLFYPLIGAAAVGLCGVLRKGAFPNVSEWEGETKAWLGAFWPISIVFWILIFPFFFIINRIFDD